ncbi:FAD-binding domain-containing protein [Hypoxylon trugodes]|uniref:FAD-binding domain-containing protein n=1 Tax=Hypoxylon trugodes TaxID=326681 RepID=UPI0021920FEB|nr:FAD-binding domain-containing protein [Hypoxylon trugodes]KAI1385617.1 FAD-binding domain-containing protein [Hypoxylon trugodes]
MARNTPETLAALQKFLSEQHPSITLLTRSSPEFEAVRACFVKRDSDVPLAIARPRSAADVQALVQYCVANDVDFLVRTGGHDCAGRTQVRDVLTIDMRDIKYVNVAEDEKTATIGGGVLFRDLTKVLDAKGLITPIGTIPTVGYVGWATLGGYGPFSTSHGLGVDQIVSAKLVDAKGELVDASDELLKGLRGGGGIFGVIVEMTIKVYPLKEMLVSLLIFESSDIKKTFVDYCAGYEKLTAEQPLPRSLQLQIFGIELPNLGKVLAVAASWAAPDFENGKIWFNKIAAFGNCLMNNPEPKKVTAWVETNENLLTYGSYGRVYTLNVKSYTQKTAEILARHTHRIPGVRMALSLHTLRVPLPNEESIFPSRTDHHMFELVATTPAKEDEIKGEEWANEILKDVRENDPENVMESSYVALTGTDDVDFKVLYGKHYDTLVALKKKYDPDNVFKYAVPRLVA